MSDYYIVEGFDDGHLAVREVGTDRPAMIFNGPNKEEEAEKFIRYRRSQPEFSVHSDKSGPGNLLNIAAGLMLVLSVLALLSPRNMGQIPNALLMALLFFAFGQLLHYVKAIRNVLQRDEQGKLGKETSGKMVSPDAPIRRLHKDAV